MAAPCRKAPTLPRTDRGLGGQDHEGRLGGVLGGLAAPQDALADREDHPAVPGDQLLEAAGLATRVGGQELGVGPAGDRWAHLGFSAL